MQKLDYCIWNKSKMEIQPVSAYCLLKMENINDFLKF